MLYLPMDILTDKYKHQQNCIQYSVGYMANFSREILTEWSRNFFLRTLSIYKSINKFITDELTNRPEITDKSFFDGMFLSVSPSVKYLPMNCECKYRWKFLSIKLLNLVVLNDDPFYIFFLILIESLFILFSSFVWYFIFFVPFFNFSLSFCCLFFFFQFLWF